MGLVFHPRIAANALEWAQHCSRKILLMAMDVMNPSHGGFYMAEGAFYIRIGLPPRVVLGDCLALSRCGLIDRNLHCRRAYPMSRDWGYTCTSYRSPHVLPFVYAALRAIL